MHIICRGTGYLGNLSLVFLRMPKEPQKPRIFVVHLGEVPPYYLAGFRRVIWYHLDSASWVWSVQEFFSL